MVSVIACTNGPVGKHQWDLHLDQIITKGWAIVRSEPSKAH